MLSLMAREFFASSPLMALPIAALGLFLFAFTVLSIRALFKPKAHIEMLARMPLDGEVLP